MEYYRILNLVREPFSNSPEPDFFYESRHHVDCLQKLEVALRLRRGLNVVVGQVGAGKTTLSRQLIRKFSSDPAVKTYLLLDPHFSTEMEFLLTVGELFGLAPAGEQNVSAWQMRERIKNFLFEEAVEKNNLIVLIIDEGQKLPNFAIEGLREFLNYETNDYKMLQIAIFAQEEFRESMDQNHAFADRINLRYNLGPLTFNDARAMINFRMKQATERGKDAPLRFTGAAMQAIYKATEGYPRKIVRLCHQILLRLIIQGKNKVDRRLVKSVINRAEETYRPVGSLWKYPVLAGVLVVLALVLVFAPGEHPFPSLERVLTSGYLKVTGTEGELSKPSALPAEAGDQDVPPEHEPGRHTVAMAADTESEEDSAGETKAETDSPDDPSAPVDDAPPAAVSKADDVVTEATALEIMDTVDTGEEPRAPPALTPRPANLGTMKIAKNQFLGRTLEEIFGSRDARIMRSFADANPHIANMDEVMAGELVTIPAIPADRPGAYREGYWIRVFEHTAIEETHKRFRTLLRRQLPLRMVSYWTQTEGLRFAIIVKERFENEEAARHALQRLPGDSAAEAEIFAGWPEGTLFFGDL